MNERRRAVLESIVAGDDSTPLEKLRAIELLHADGDRHERRDFSDLTDAELDAAFDQDFSGDLPALLAAELDGVPAEGVAALWGKIPRTARAVAAEVERRAEVKARQIADADRIEREIETRAEERA